MLHQIHSAIKKKKKLRILKNLYFFFNYKMLDSYSFANMDMITLAEI